MQTFFVETTAQFHAALKTASPGDRIEMAGNDFGDIRIHNQDFGTGIQIVAADPANPPLVNSMSLWNAHGVTIDNISFEFKPTTATVEWSSAFRADLSSNITVTNSSFKGGDAVNGVSADSAPGTQGASGIEGLPIGRAITFQDCANIRIENNTIERFSSGIRLNDIDGISIVGNEIHDFRRVAVGGAEVSNALIDSNYFHDANPWNYGGKGDHGDFIHLWTATDQTTPSQNITISNNQIFKGDGVSIIGIYLDDNQNNMGFMNVTISNNVISNENSQAIRIENAVGLDITKNTIIPTVDNINGLPMINLVSARDVTIDLNIFGGIVGKALSDLAGNSISILNNLAVQMSSPSEQNYIGNIFVNALRTDAGPSDLAIIPGSIGDGYGATANTLTAVPNKLTSFICSEAGVGRDLNTHTFSVAELLDKNDVRSLVNASVSWDFGDGSRTTGSSVEHTFLKAGFHNVTATITLASGETVIQERTIDVRQPLALVLDFEGNAHTAIESLTGNASLADVGQNSVVVLGDTKSFVRLEGSPDLLKNEAFSISFSFQKEDAAVGGRAIYYSGTAVIDLGGNSISLMGRTDTGESIKLSAKNVEISDTDWHKVTYTYDQSSGNAILYIDGQEVARQEGLTGAQHTTFGHRIHLGSPFGGSFQGLIDDFVFARYALSPEDIRQDDLGNTDAPSTGGEISLPPTLDFEILAEKPGSPVVIFDASSISAQYPEGTLFTWHFGDGTSATGERIEHIFLTSGRFDVQLSARLPDGRENSVQSVVAVDTQPLLHLSDNGTLVVTQDGARDAIQITGPLDPEGGIQLGGPGISASVARSHLAPILGSDDVTISLRLDADAAGTTGEVLRLTGSFIVSVDYKGELMFRAWSSEGEAVKLTSTGIRVNDGSSYDIDIRLEEGRMSLWVDGKMVQDAAFNGTFADVGRHDLTFGNPWHSSFFNGDVTEFAIAVNDGPTLFDPFSAHAMDMAAPLM